MSHVTCTDKTRLHVKDWGEGSAVVLIHGWPLSSDSWEDQSMALADVGHRVVAYDRRGFGRSSQPWSGYDYDTLADDLAAVIAQTGVEDAVLVGFSMGGGEVARYLSRHGTDAVSKAVLVSSVLPFRLKTADNPAGAEQAGFDRTMAALNEDRAEFLAGFFRDFFGVDDSQDTTVSEERLAWMRSIALQASLKATLECVKSFSSTDFRGDLEAFRLPTLFIHGTADKTVPIEASSRLAVRAIPEATLIEYGGAPHGLFATHRERLNRDLLDFIGESPPRA